MQDPRSALTRIREEAVRLLEGACLADPAARAARGLSPAPLHPERLAFLPFALAPEALTAAELGQVLPLVNPWGGPAQLLLQQAIAGSPALTGDQLLDALHRGAGLRFLGPDDDPLLRHADQGDPPGGIPWTGLALTDSLGGGDSVGVGGSVGPDGFVGWSAARSAWREPRPIEALHGVLRPLCAHPAFSPEALTLLTDRMPGWPSPRPVMNPLDIEALAARPEFRRCAAFRAIAARIPSLSTRLLFLRDLLDGAEGEPSVHAEHTEYAAPAAPGETRPGAAHEVGVELRDTLAEIVRAPSQLLDYLESKDGWWLLTHPVAGLELLTLLLTGPGTRAGRRSPRRRASGLGPASAPGPRGTVHDRVLALLATLPPTPRPEAVPAVATSVPGRTP